jgi:hypothetical protein
VIAGVLTDATRVVMPTGGGNRSAINSRHGDGRRHHRHQPLIALMKDGGCPQTRASRTMINSFSLEKRNASRDAERRVKLVYVAPGGSGGITWTRCGR